MPFFQLGEMGRPFYGEDWASDALRRMREVYMYMADKKNQEGERNKRLYDSASGKHQEFLLGEMVYVQLDRQLFTKVKNKKWVKCWKEAIITRVLSETTYEVQYVIGNGALGRKSIVHCNRLKGVGSQAQKDILAEAQQRQEAALAGTLGASDEPDSNNRGEGGERRGDSIWRADGNMWNVDRRSVEEGTSSQAIIGSSKASTPDGDRVKFYIGSDKKEDTGEWTTVWRRKGRASMRGALGARRGVEAPAKAASGRGTEERRFLDGGGQRGGPVGQQAGRHGGEDQEARDQPKEDKSSSGCSREVHSGLQQPG